MFKKFIDDWSFTGQLSYTFLVPTPNLIRPLMKLIQYASEDASRRPCEKVRASPWLRAHLKTMQWALDVTHAADIFDGKYDRDWTTKRPTRKKSSDIPDYTKMQQGEVQF